jgi:SAM-dependent methyltransferase
MLKVSVRASPSEKREAARIIQEEWEWKWRTGFHGRWADRPAPPEVAKAVASGWLPPTGRMVDLGCGTAEIAAWFAERGYHATAIDIAQAAVDRAAEKHAVLAARMDFIALDLSTQSLPGRTFDILIDRGCLHQIPLPLCADYARNVAAMAAPGAKMILFMKAFRDGRPFGDADEAKLRTIWAKRILGAYFELERAEPANLNPDSDENPLPGMAFWLTRRDSQH